MSKVSKAPNLLYASRIHFSNATLGRGAVSAVWQESRCRKGLVQIRGPFAKFLGRKSIDNLNQTYTQPNVQVLLHGHEYCKLFNMGISANSYPKAGKGKADKEGQAVESRSHNNLCSYFAIRYQLYMRACLYSSVQALIAQILKKASLYSC